MVSTNDVWAVGEDVFLHWNGSNWTEILSPNDSVWLEDVDMVSAGDGWAVGSDYSIFRWNGTSWTEWLNAFPSNGYFNDVDMMSAAEGWAVGDFGAIMHWNGNDWEYTTGLDSDRPDYFGVDGLTASDGWVVGSNGALLQGSSSGWLDFNLPFAPRINDLDFVSSTDGWAVGDYGLIMRWDGGNWAPFTSPVTVDLNAVAMVATNDGWIVGDNGTILRWNGVSWSVSASPVSDSLYSISMISASDGWAVGISDYFLRWNGASWSTTPSPNKLFFHSVDFLTAMDGWAVGGVFIGPPNMLSGYIYHWDGAQWSRVTSPVQSQYLYTVDIIDSSHIWVAGDQWDTVNQSVKNVVMFYDGVDFSEVYSNDTIPTGLFGDISSTGFSDVWIVGDYGTITHWDGNNWVQVESPTSGNLNAVSMLTVKEGWIVGNHGVILRYIPPPVIEINYTSGAPGSFFTISGTDFPADSTVDLSVNGHALDQIQTDSSGGFTVILDTSNAEEGVYFFSAVLNPTYTTSFRLDAAEPLRPQEGSASIYELPSGIAFTDFIYIPYIQR
jgi:photosystem II stability/assembly factor-like uncharacterized protein